MSAYVVEAKTIDAIVSWIMSDREMAYERRELLAIVGGDPDKLAQTLGQDLLAMNVEAVNQRYKETDAPPVYNHEFVLVPTQIHALKALRCLMYQCAEGEVPQMPLYKIMQEVSHGMALSIVRSLPAYDMAEWG